MTRVNLKLKIHWVDRLFVGDEFRTNVWIAGSAFDKLERFQQKSRSWLFGKKLREYAKVGFSEYEGKEGAPIRYEGKGVWRIRHSGKFRLIGFYDGFGKECFIAIDGDTKERQKLSQAQRGRIEAVARIKAHHTWRKRNP